MREKNHMRPRRYSPERASGVLALVLLVALLGVLAPVPIPDTHSPSGATATVEVNDWASTGHTFRVDRDGLYRIDVAMSTIRATAEADVQFYVRERGPDGPNLRVLRRKLSELPEGKALELYGARWRDLPWVTFEFEPLYGYRGSQLYFNVEGKEIPRENTVQALIAYPNGYDLGQAYTSEKPTNGNLIFRTHTRGSLAELLASTFPSMAEGRPGFLGLAWVYQAAAGLAVLLAALLLAAIPRLED